MLDEKLLNSPPFTLTSVVRFMSGPPRVKRSLSAEVKTSTLRWVLQKLWKVKFDSRSKPVCCRIPPKFHPAKL